MKPLTEGRRCEKIVCGVFTGVGDGTCRVVVAIAGLRGSGCFGRRAACDKTFDLLHVVENDARIHSMWSDTPFAGPTSKGLRIEPETLGQNAGLSEAKGIVSSNTWSRLIHDDWVVCPNHQKPPDEPTKGKTPEPFKRPSASERRSLFDRALAL